MGLDWTGNKKSTFIQLGASNHSNKEREQNDFYATDPKSLEIFLEKLDEDKIYLHKNIWECACGKGHLSKVLEEKGYNVHSTDIVDRGYGIGNVDFLKQDTSFEGDILTNPPFKYAEKFVEKSQLDLDYVDDNYIPKQKVKDKIEKYNRKMEEDVGHPNWIIVDKIVINVLQELLEGENKNV